MVEKMREMLAASAGDTLSAERPEATGGGAAKRPATMVAAAAMGAPLKRPAAAGPARVQYAKPATKRRAAAGPSRVQHKKPTTAGPARPKPAKPAAAGPARAKPAKPAAAGPANAKRAPATEGAPVWMAPAGFHPQNGRIQGSQGPVLL